MRIHLALSKAHSVIPFDHIPVLAGTLHKWLGENEWHNQISLYSFSWLKGTATGNKGLYFQRGGEWFISSYSTDFIKRLIHGIQNDPTINYGISVKSITIQEDPVF